MASSGREQIEELLRGIGDIEQPNVLAEDQEEFVMEMLEAHFRTDLRKENTAQLPESIQNIFQKIANAIRRVYGRATGKSYLPQDIQDAFNSFFWNGDQSEVSQGPSETQETSQQEPLSNEETIRNKAMKEGYPQRKSEYLNKIRRWLSKENYERFTGKTLAQISEVVGNNLEAIGEVPQEVQDYFSVSDSRVYSGAAYFIEHAVNRHGELDVNDYVAMADVFENYNSSYIQEDGALILRKEGRPSSQVIIVLDNDTGKMILYRTYFNTPKINKKWTEINLKASSVPGTSPSVPKENTLSALAISSQDDASNQTVSSESEDVNVRSQGPIGESAVEEGEKKFMRMADDRFIRSIEKDIFLPEYVIKAKLCSENPEVRRTG